MRELLDNAIDAGADSIAVHVADGGVTSVRVADNGVGMSRDDLDLCWKSHATSKIDSIEDLDRLASLGFRGEALSSIASCCRMTITTRARQEQAALRLRVESGRAAPIEELSGPEGTTVDAADLFYSLPARRRFLKSPGAEAALCRAVTVEKALPFPGIEFRFFLDGQMKLFLPRVESLAERIGAAYPGVVGPSLLHRVEAREQGHSLAAITAGPSVYRRDRRYIQCFVNSRRVDEYALVQAVQYAYQDHVPGGSFPVAFVFLSIDPALVDFNIHPAKREVRFRNLGEIHHTLVVSLRDFLARFNRSYAGGAGSLPRSEGGSGPERDQSLYAAEGPGAQAAVPTLCQPPRPIREIAGELAPRPAPPAPSDIRYFGQLFNLFLLAAKGERFFIVDQHAAHERVLFEQFRSGRGMMQRLLVPIEFEVTPDQEAVLSRREAEYRRLGIELARRSSGRWAVTAIPEAFRSLEQEVVQFVLEERGDERSLEQELYARISCRAAVKEGDRLDEGSARELIERAFALENARCPHGRPIWHELSRTELYRLVGRL